MTGKWIVCYDDDEPCSLKPSRIDDTMGKLKNTLMIIVRPGKTSREFASLDRLTGPKYSA